MIKIYKERGFLIKWLQVRADKPDSFLLVQQIDFTSGNSRTPGFTRTSCIPAAAGHYPKPDLIHFRANSGKQPYTPDDSSTSDETCLLGRT